ncbi:MAG: hypothetical protein PVI90_12610, partial [Desulfobacteraceae bacterium]
MKTIQLAAPYSTQPPFSLRINLPPSVGEGGVSIDAFTSGLQLMVMDSKLEQSAFIKSNSSGFTVGVGFCLTGY